MLTHSSCQVAWCPRFAVLKAFLLDKDMADLSVEAHYVEMAKEKTKVNWEELPLDELEKIYSTEEQRKWLKEKVVDRQTLKSIIRKVLLGNYQMWCLHSINCTELILRPDRPGPPAGLQSLANKLNIMTPFFNRLAGPW